MINFFSEFSKMELKDIFYTLGILFTFSIGLLNYITTLKNRRNVLREHVYKEQFNVFSKLNFEFHKLNCILIKALKVKVNNDVIKENIENIENIFYSNIHILPTKLSFIFKELITLGEDFVVKNDQTNSILLPECYNDFNEKYYVFIKLIVKELGVSELYVENKKLVQK